MKRTIANLITLLKRCHLCLFTLFDVNTLTELYSMERRTINSVELTAYLRTSSYSFDRLRLILPVQASDFYIDEEEKVNSLF